MASKLPPRPHKLPGGERVAWYSRFEEGEMRSLTDLALATSDPVERRGIIREMRLIHALKAAFDARMIEPDDEIHRDLEYVVAPREAFADQ